MIPFVFTYKAFRWTVTPDMIFWVLESLIHCVCTESTMQQQHTLSDVDHRKHSQPS